jgi:hypothetical protein
VVQSTTSSSFPARRTGPYAISRQPIVAVGLISIIAGAPGVRAIRNRKSDCAPATADFASSVRDGRSSLCV